MSILFYIIDRLTLLLTFFRFHLEGCFANLTRALIGSFLRHFVVSFYDMLASMFAFYMLLTGSFTSLMQFGIQAPTKVGSDAALTTYVFAYFYNNLGR